MASGYIDFGAFFKGVEDARNASWQQELREQQRIQNMVGRQEYAELQDRKREEHEWKRLSELGKQAERDWQGVLRGYKQTELERGEVKALSEMEDAAAKKAASSYLSNFATNRAMYIKSGGTAAQFLMGQQQAVLDDPQFQRMSDAEQSYVLNYLTNVATAQIAEATAAGDYATANELSRAFGRQGPPVGANIAGGSNPAQAVVSYNQAYSKNLVYDEMTGAITVDGLSIPAQLVVEAMARGPVAVSQLAAVWGGMQQQEEAQRAILGQYGGGGAAEGGPVGFIPNGPDSPQRMAAAQAEQAQKDSVVEANLTDGDPVTAAQADHPKNPEWVAETVEIMRDSLREVPMHEMGMALAEATQHKNTLDGLVKQLEKSRGTLQREGASAQQMAQVDSALSQLAYLTYAAGVAQAEMRKPIKANATGSMQERVAHFLLSPDAVYREALSDLDAARATLDTIKSAKAAGKKGIRELLMRIHPSADATGRAASRPPEDAFERDLARFEKSLEATLAEARQ